MFYLFICLFAFLGLAYATVTATRDPSRVCDLHHGSWQCWIHNPLSEAGDQTRIHMDPSQICFHCATTEAPYIVSSQLKGSSVEDFLPSQDGYTQCPLQEGLLVLLVLSHRSWGWVALWGLPAVGGGPTTCTGRAASDRCALREENVLVLLGFYKTLSSRFRSSLL